MTDLVSPRTTTPRVAAWDHPLAEPNLQDAHIAHALARLAGKPGLGRVEETYRQRFRFKSWQYMTAVSDELFIAFIVGTAGFASNGFVYAAELATGGVHQKFAIMPLMLGTELAPSSTAGTHRFATRGLRVTMENAGRSFAARIDARTKDGERLVADLAFTSDARDEHLAVCVPLPGERWNYTHKFAAFGVTGHVTIGERRIAFPAGRSFGTLDFTKSYPLRHTMWRWVAVAGRTRAGQTIGLNLVDPTPAAPVSENALWIDGKRQAVANVVLDAARARGDGVDLAIRPIATVEQRLDVPLLRHRLHHVIATMSGSVVTTSGDRHELESVVGIFEDYDTWW